MPGFEIRTATADDLGAIAAGFAAACGKPLAAVEPGVRQALGTNPAGSSGVVAVDTLGKIVAHFGASHVPMVIEGEPALLGRACACWLDPRLKIAGVHGAFGEIDAAYRERFEGPAILATYGMFSESDWWTLRRLHDFWPVRTEIMLERRARPRRADPAKVAVTPLGEALVAFEDGLALGGSHARRDRAALAFRTQGAWAGDSGWAALRSGKPLGVAIVRDRGQERIVLDLSIAPEDEDAARALIDAVIGDGSRTVLLPFFTRSPWMLLAQRSGFRARAADLPYVGIRPSKGKTDASKLMDAWHFGACDVGFRPIPPMLAREEIVTSAPMGTASGHERHA